MAIKVNDCLKATQFGGNVCTVLRGAAKDVPFDNELSIASFLKKSEQKKDEDDDGTYSPEQGSLWLSERKALLLLNSVKMNS